MTWGLRKDPRDCLNKWRDPQRCPTHVLWTRPNWPVVEEKGAAPVETFQLRRRVRGIVLPLLNNCRRSIRHRGPPLEVSFLLRPAALLSVGHREATLFVNFAIGCRAILCSN